MATFYEAPAEGPLLIPAEQPADCLPPAAPVAPIGAPVHAAGAPVLSSSSSLMSSATRSWKGFSFS